MTTSDVTWNPQSGDEDIEFDNVGQLKRFP
jgi:hypothetical protein